MPLNFSGRDHHGSSLQAASLHAALKVLSPSDYTIGHHFAGAYEFAGDSGLGAWLVHGLSASPHDQL